MMRAIGASAKGTTYLRLRGDYIIEVSDSGNIKIDCDGATKKCPMIEPGRNGLVSCKKELKLLSGSNLMPSSGAYGGESPGTTGM
jgi:hypothetical protein